MIATRDYAPDDPIYENPEIAPLLGRLKSFLQESEFDFPGSLPVEISHHYGLAKFNENGAFIICPQEDPLKKILILLPGQSHPLHFHHEKNETFRVLRGSLDLEVDGNCIHLGEGEEFLIPRGSWHRFSSLPGAVVEERIDTSGEDSQYEDSRIQELARHERKTIVPFA
jgi:N-acetylneuraminate synthase